MKKILFSLLILSVYAAANTCTETIFNIAANFLVKQNKVILDSLYYVAHKTNSEEMTKFYYTNGKIDSSVSVTPNDLDGKYSKNTYYYYWDTDETKIETKYATLLSQEQSGDTIFFYEKKFINGSIDYSKTIKITNSYISSLLSYDNTFVFKEETISNDTLFTTNIYDYQTDLPRTYTYILVADPSNDLKCNGFEIEGDNQKPYNNYEIVYTDQGFIIRELKDYNIDNYVLTQYFYITPENSTTIQKRLAPVKISPKARYFDLLGRYKFTR